MSDVPYQFCRGCGKSSFHDTINEATKATWRHNNACLDLLDGRRVPEALLETAGGAKLTLRLMGKAAWDCDGCGTSRSADHALVTLAEEGQFIAAAHQHAAGCR